MHLSRILDQIKRHPSPTEALTKLGKAMDKHEDNLLEKGFRILKSELCANVYEAINGPHFDEEHAKMNHCHQVNSQCLCRIGVSL